MGLIAELDGHSGYLNAAGPSPQVCYMLIPLNCRVACSGCGTPGSVTLVLGLSETAWCAQCDAAGRLSSFLSGDDFLPTPIARPGVARRN
jgi:hypothetical protein